MLKSRFYDKKYKEHSEEPHFRLLIDKKGKTYNSEEDKYYDFEERYRNELFFDVDKDENEMYEHDIISIHRFLFDGSEHEDEIIGILKRDKFGFFIAITRPHEITRYMGYQDNEVKEIAVHLSELGLHEESFTKLGNIYENSDLLS